MSVDWGLAARIAGLAAGDGDTLPPAPPGLDAIAADARDQVVTATGLEPRDPLPPVEWVSRKTWIAANLETMKVTLGPALERSTQRTPGALKGAAGAVLAAELGGLLGMLSRRVMGQYDVRLLEPEAAPRLLLVAPNLDTAATELGADRTELVTWVTLHEVTHAVQFGAVGWLQEHLAGLMRELIESLDVRADPKALLRLDLTDLRAMADRVREGGLMLAVVGPERQALIDRLQAAMALVEGHAEWTMDRAGQDVLRDVGELRGALDRRRASRAPLLRILDRLLGFELKLRQYEIGRDFCDAVAAAEGLDGILDAWSSPEAAPELDELSAPARWLARRRPAAA